MTVNWGGSHLEPWEAEDLEFDEVNEAHLGRHQITITEVTQVWWNGPVYVPNKKNLTATWLMLGDTYGNRALTIPVATIDVSLRLRPITGWNSTVWELTKWRSRRTG